MVTKKVGIGAVALCVISGIIVLAFNVPTQRSEDTLILGTMSGWPPFVSINQEGSYEGLDIDIANIIAKRLKKKLIIKDMDLALVIQALDQGQVDFIMTGLDMTSERMKRMAMVRYQGTPITSYPLIFWQKAPNEITSFNDLKKLPNAVICVEAGSSQEEVLTKYSGFTLKNVDPLVSLLELKTGRATASLLCDKMVRTFQEKEPNLVAIQIPLDASERILGCGIGIKQSNIRLIKEITAIIEDLMKTRTLESLEKKWIPSIRKQAMGGDQ